MNHMITDGYAPEPIKEKKSPYCDCCEYPLERYYILTHNHVSYQYCPECYIKQIDEIVDWHTVPFKLCKQFNNLLPVIESGSRKFTKADNELINEILKYSK